MGFQEARLVSDVGIAHRVGLVERIRGESLPVAPDFIHQLLHILSLPFRPLHELRIVQATGQELPFQFRHRLQLFLTHRLAQRVGHTAGKVPQCPRLEHHLLLVNGNPVSILQERLHHGMVVCDRLLAVLAPDERRDILHRSRTVQGVHRNEVLEAVGL